MPGNITDALGATWSYDDLNRLTSANAGAGATTFAFDPVNRLATSTVGGVSTRRQYMGDQLVAEYNPATGAMTKRYIPGLGLDDVAVAYDGAGTSARTWQLADERGSVIALSGSTGAVSTINTYDEYGVPGSGNVGRFQYTGQQWLPEAGAYHYRARTYLPQVGRFLQTDPIGYAAGANLYAYVGADPVNMIDPSGTEQICTNGGTRNYLDSNGELVAERIRPKCVEIPDIRQFFNWTVGSVENYFAEQCSLGDPGGRFRFREPEMSSNARSAIGHVAEMSARAEGPQSEAWQRNAAAVNRVGTLAMSSYFAMEAVSAAENGYSPVFAGARAWGQITSTVGMDLLVEAAFNVSNGGAAAPAGYALGQATSTIWAEQGGADAYGEVYARLAGAVMGCS